MGECRYCGKKGVFLNVGQGGLCEQCTKELSAYVDEGRADVAQKIAGIGQAETRQDAIKCCEDALRGIGYFDSTYIKNGVTEAEDMLLKQRGVQAYLDELNLMKDMDYKPRPMEGGETHTD